jgi:putative FmdB family regulatory protein
MPLYEYACAGCGDEFEVEQRITDEPVKSCPACRSRKVKRLISQTSFVLKGSGWHADLYSSKRGKDKAADAAGTAESSKQAAASSDATSESKPVSKPESKAKDKQKVAKVAA